METRYSLQTDHPDAPSSQRQSLIHRKSVIIGQPLRNSKTCKCCGAKYQKKTLDVMFQKQDTYYLDSGLGSYFLFIKSCALITLALTVVFSIPNAIINFITDECSQLSWCSPTKYIRLSIMSKSQNWSMIYLQDILCTVSAVIMVIGIQIMRKRMRDLEHHAKKFLNQSDFAVVISIKTDLATERDIKRGFEDWWQLEKDKPEVHPDLRGSFPVEKVVLSYKVSQLEELKTQRDTLREEQKLWKKGKQFKNTQAKKEIKQKLQRIDQIEAKLLNRQLTRTSKCVVIFRYPQQRDYVIEKHEKTIGNVLFGCWRNKVKILGETVAVKAAALPSEVNWHNHQIESRKKQLIRLGVQVASVAVLLAAECLVFGVLYLTFKNQEGNTTTGNTQVDEYIPVVLSTVNTIISIILDKVLRVLSRYQFRSTSFEQRVSITIKITIAGFLNKGVMLFFAYYILDVGSIWLSNGFIDTMTWSYIQITFLPHILHWMDFSHITKAYQRFKLKSNPISQIQANKIYQRPPLQVHDRYAWIISVMWWTCVFAPMIPIAFPCTAVSLFIHYWSDKFQYVSMVREPKPFGSYLNQELMKVLQFSPMLLVFGNVFIIYWFLYNALEPYYIILDLVSMGIALLALIMPTAKMARLFSKISCQKVEATPGHSYQNASRNFVTTYQMENPTYIQQRVERMNNQKKLSRQQPQYNNIEMTNFNRV